MKISKHDRGEYFFNGLTPGTVFSCGGCVYMRTTDNFGHSVIELTTGHLDSLPGNEIVVPYFEAELILQGPPETCE